MQTNTYPELSDIRIARARVAALTEELNDDICRRIPLARKNVQKVLDEELAKLRSWGY